MASPTLFDYLRDDHTVIDSLVDLLTPPTPTSETEWLSLWNEADDQIMHEHNTAFEDPDKSPKFRGLPLSYGSNPIFAHDMVHCDFLPAYPKSHPYGYAYAVNTQATHPHLIKHPLTSVQYASRQVGKRQMECLYLDARVEKFHYRCSGVKACEFLHPDFKTLDHTEVTEEMFTKMANLRAQHGASEAGRRKRETYRFFSEIQLRFSNKTACSAAQGSCFPVFQPPSHNDMSDTSPPFIVCSSATAETAADHFRQFLAEYESRLDFDILEGLLLTPNIPIYEPCGVVESTATRRPKCGVSHVQGMGKLVPLECKVTFDIFVPLDLDFCPFIIFLSTGTHTHPPPPPNKPPQEILGEILHIIKQRQGPDLSTNLLLKAPALKAFCQQYSGMTLSQIHSKFADQDPISAIAMKEKALTWPEGQDLRLLIYGAGRNEDLKQYVRNVFVDENGTMIFCAYHDQLKLLGSLQSFEVFVTYNRSGALNEVIFMRYLHEHGKAITLLRVLIDKDSTSSYKLLFERMFKLVSEVCEKPTKFYYLHGRGFRSIVMDMCPRQMTGLGMYLMGLDPQGRGWKWQLRHIMIFSPAHFLRNIAKLTSDIPDPSDPEIPTLEESMRGLLHCETQEEYYRLLDSIQEIAPKNLYMWAEHKKDLVIAAGTCTPCSMMIPGLYHDVHDEMIEIPEDHYRSYLKGVYSDIFDAINNARAIDKRGIEEYHAQNQLLTQKRLESGNPDPWGPPLDRMEFLRKRKRDSHLQHLDSANGASQSNDPAIDHWLSEVIRPSIRSRSPSWRQSESRLRSPSIPRTASPSSKKREHELRCQLLDLEREHLRLRSERLAIQAKELEYEHRIIKFKQSAGIQF